MNTEITLFITFLILFILSIFLIGSVEILIKRKKAQKRYIMRLEKENAYLQRTVSFLKVALETKGGK